MHVAEAIRIALQSLWVNKLRSVLTLLGVVIGVAAVIAVVTFVSGINDYVAQKVFNLGADVFIIFKVSPAVTNVDHFLEGEKRRDLTMEDYQAVADACRHCEYVGAVLRNEAGHVKFGEQSISDTSVRGITPSMAPIYDTDLSAGRMVNETDLNNRAPVAVVGADIVAHLMAGADPVGNEIRLDGWTYQVIGVGTKKGTTLGQSADNYVMIPITSYLKQYGAHNNSIRISGKALSAGVPLDEAVDESRAALRAKRHDAPGGDDSFDIETNASLLGIWTNFSQTFFVATIGIACISLVVRHCHYEHHAGRGDGTDARDRHSQGAGSAARGCVAAVSDRVGHACGCRRSPGSFIGSDGGRDVHLPYRNAIGHQALGGRSRAGRIRQRGSVLWSLPGAEGGATRSHCCAQVRNLEEFSNRQFGN